MRSMIPVILCSFACGCALGAAPEEDEGDGERVASIDEALTTHNALEPNGIHPNGIHPNGIHPNGLGAGALTPGAMSATATAALADPGVGGDLSRKFMKYVVSCAYAPGHSFSFDWVDSSSVAHHEVYSGSLGLAPGWETGAISASEQRWVSACIAARTNYFAISVLISMRGDSPNLGADALERSGFPNMEGAFWGNLFTPTPSVYSCYNAPTVSKSRSKNRDCATGYFDGTSTSFCGILTSVGDCSSKCNALSDPASGFTSCDGVDEVIATFLPD